MAYKEESQNCNNCFFGDTRNDILECHEESPFLESGEGVWPRVKWFQWCGKWKIEEGENCNE